MASSSSKPDDRAQDETPEAHSDGNHGDNTDNVEAHTLGTESVQVNPNNADGVDATLDASASIESDNDLRVPFQPNIFDPRYWDGLDQKQVDILVQKGPKRDLSIQKGPKDRLSRRFSAALYTRILSNGETFGTRLKDHETSADHITNMASWYDMRLRFDNNQTIDKVAHREIEKEKEHWRKVLFRIILIAKFLAKHNLAFRGTNSKLYQDNNGNFLGMVEMMAEFDPVMQEHVQRITNDDIHTHYLGHGIQNEVIDLLAASIRSEIIRKIKESKYFSVILDCTPDISHQEQMSLIIRYVDTSSYSICIEESFLGFLDINDTTGQGLFDVLQNELKNLDLDIDNVRGQGYDNGSNMKGKNIGVQKKVLEINPRAFYSACGCHSLNLALCDMAKSCGKAKDFFGIIQRIYTIFGKSTKRWQILKDKISGFTLKPLSATRWESRVDSVKAIRFQMQDIREALLEVSDTDNDATICSEAKSLATNELGDFEFIVAIVIWYEVLSAINLVSKQLQAKDMLIDIAIEKVQGLISFFTKYRETGFPNALESAKEIAREMDVEPTFRTKRKIKRKRQFDEAPEDESIASQSTEELIRINYFLSIVDQAIASLTKRFEQYQGYEKTFGFLFTSKKLCSLDDKSLLSSCAHLEAALKSGDHSDIDGKELHVELKFLQDFIPKEDMGPLDILKFVKRMGCFPNALVAYRILLTIPVTVASAERSFSKLKLLKTYMRSTMKQERLNGLATIALENDLLEKIKYEDIIEDFISKNTRRMMIFNGS
nr:zinc finger MYM-type protein 1-like [Setaria viridis]